MEPPHDPRKLEKHRFAAQFAAFLDAARGQDSFDRCILVAPPRSLGEIRSLLSERVKERVWSEVPKDLAGAGAEELGTILGSELEHAATGMESPAA
jgi:protein required for attachment to host cells